MFRLLNRKRTQKLYFILVKIGKDYKKKNTCTGSAADCHGSDRFLKIS